MAQQKVYNCPICNNYRATHLPMNCPYGMKLSHGTKVSNLSNICRVGLLPSNKGRLGAGLYLTSPQVAATISTYKGYHNYSEGTGVCVIHCTINAGNIKDNGKANDYKGSWRNQYDSCKGIHPKWLNQPEFVEYCLKNPQKCVIREVELVNGVIDGDINLPNVTIRIRGNCHFKGNITAGSLVFG
eukprot:62506_1